MKRSLKDSLSRAVLEEVSTRVLEESALLCARLLPRAPRPLSRWEALGARLNFSGAFRGQLEAWIPRPIAARLADNLLGGEPGGQSVDGEPGARTFPGRPVDEEAVWTASDEIDLDAIRELLGILCISFMAALTGTDADLRLGTATRCVRLEPLEGGGHERELWLEVEGEPVLLRLRLAAASS